MRCDSNRPAAPQRRLAELAASILCLVLLWPAMCTAAERAGPASQSSAAVGASMAGATARAAGTDAAGAPAGLFPAQIPFKRDGDDAAGIGVGFAALIAGGCLLLGVVWTAYLRKTAAGGARRTRGMAARLPWLTRFSGGTGDPVLRVLATTALTPQARLHVVQWRGRQYLLSSTPDRLRVLDRLHVIDDVADGATGDSTVRV